MQITFLLKLIPSLAHHLTNEFSLASSFVSHDFGEEVSHVFGEEGRHSSQSLEQLNLFFFLRLNNQLSKLNRLPSPSLSTLTAELEADLGTAEEEWLEHALSRGADSRRLFLLIIYIHGSDLIQVPGQPWYKFSISYLNYMYDCYMYLYI